MSTQTQQPAPGDRTRRTSSEVSVAATTEVEEARALGRAAGRYSDLRLRQDESRERERLLTKAAWFGSGREGATPEADSYEVAKLRSQAKETGEYLQAIENSVAWRAIQWLRGLFGRAW